MKTPNQITGHDLLTIGFPNGPAFGEALKVANNFLANDEKVLVLAQLTQIAESPKVFANHSQYGALAEALLKMEANKTIELKELSGDYPTYGAAQIEQGATDQMDLAMRLPIAEKGALMPDAHQGYGLPIGGVLATKNAIIPYGVGVDIGCRMCLSVFDRSPIAMVQKEKKFVKALKENTRFGQQTFDNPIDHEVIGRKEFDEIAMLKNMRSKAFSQIGSSGGGNHFVEFGTVEILDENNEFGLKVGKYLALLSHSGSRGMGAFIARHYTNLAKKLCPLPKGAQHLAWLDMNSEAGQEYWLAMNLAGDYASACHHQIHQRIHEAIGGEMVMRVENHHNFAWQETIDGEDYIVHRKGATPADKGVLGVIPGSMTAPGFIVRGKGMANALNSAAHGAGRKMSRKQAIKSVKQEKFDEKLRKASVKLIGGGLDESPFAYKNIEKVMEYQMDLVEVIGTFQPKIVRMEG